MTNKKQIAVVFAIAAAALYAINIPLSKLLLIKVDTTMMAAFLYLGAGIGMFIYSAAGKFAGKEKKSELITRKELPYTVVMVVLDIIAPILLMAGINRTNSANVSLLNNFEIVATSIIALIIFEEVISKRLWLAIGLVTLASVILSFEGEGAFVFNEGSLLVLGAAKTSAFYSIAPFLGVGFSMLLLGEEPGLQFYIALTIMAVSTVMMAKDTINQEESDT